MSTKLALSSTLSVLMMAAFALCGSTVTAGSGEGHGWLVAPAKAELRLPAMPALPGLR